MTTVGTATASSRQRDGGNGRGRGTGTRRSPSRRRSAMTRARQTRTPSREAARATFKLRCAVQWKVTVVGRSVGEMYQPLALPSTSVGGPSEPDSSDAVQASLYPSPSTTQQPCGHGETSTVRPVRDVELTV